MSARVWAAALTILAGAGCAQAATWYLANAQLIDAGGTTPSVWGQTVAYLDGTGGPVMFYDGTESILIHDPQVSNWEPANANGSVAWRNIEYGTAIKDIFRWDGTFPIQIDNVSNSAAVDSDLAAGGNGDLIWTRKFTGSDDRWLYYYDASVGAATLVGVKGAGVSLYIAEGEVATYAYQDLATDEVKYFDGTTTHIVGTGTSEGANPSVWDGAVAWIGDGAVGDDFTRTEVFYWKDGQAQRVTDDDGAGAIADQLPQLWNDKVIWSRRVSGPFQPPALYLWDGSQTVPLTATGGEYPSFQGGQVAWVDASGLHLATLVGPADCNEDGLVDLDDYADFADCLAGPVDTPTSGCECFDLNESGHVDLADFAGLQQLLLES